MGRSSTKSKARDFYREHPTVTLKELQDIYTEVSAETVSKYHNEFRKLYGVKAEDVPDKISVSKLEKELSLQLERNPSPSVLKSCMDFLKLKAMSDNHDDEFDMSLFIKKGKES